jgi:hypothetical protein
MRKLSDVIDEILSVVPETEPHLRNNLEGVKVKLKYAPPEDLQSWWGYTYDVLMDSVPISVPVQDWVVDIFSIWTTTDKATVKENIKNDVIDGWF